MGAGSSESSRFAGGHAPRLGRFVLGGAVALDWAPTSRDARARVAAGAAGAPGALWVLKPSSLEKG